jgi:hypothetical protein
MGPVEGLARETPHSRDQRILGRIGYPMEVPLGVGDCIRCLRSAADYLISALARAADLSDESVIFPFAEKREVVEGFFEGGTVSKKGRPIRAKALYPVYCKYPDLKKVILDKIQPYSAKCGAAPMGDLLWRVITMDNIDKHRLITPALQIAGNDSVRFKGGGGIFGIATVGDVFRFGPDIKLEESANITLDILFDSNTRLPNKPIVSSLVSAATAVTETVEIFQAHFQGEQSA